MPQNKIDTAFVHCWVLPGGALNVFEDLIKDEVLDIEEKRKRLNDGDLKIFTLTSDRDTWEIEGVGKLPVVTALPKWLNKWFQYFSFHRVPVLSFFADYRNLMFFYPLLMKRLSRKIRKSGADHIVISSFAIGKNLEMCKGARDPETSSGGQDIKLYLHSPMQYIWSHHDDYLKKLHGFKLWLFKRITRRLRKWDLRFTQYNHVWANSQYTADLAKELYDIEAQVHYPKIDSLFHVEQATNSPSQYYVLVGRLTKLVREVDKIINLFKKNNQSLLVLGSGPDEAELKAMASDNIIFLGRIDDPAEKVKIIKHAKGLINITKESFGIGTVEALLLGVPVLGLNDGATPELVDADSGVLADHTDMYHLEKKFEEFSTTEWDRVKIAQKIREKLET